MSDKVRKFSRIVVSWIGKLLHNEESDLSRQSDLLMNTEYAIHVYNGGVNREMILHNEADYERFLLILWESPAKSWLSLIAYVLLPNHFHVIAQQNS